MTDLAEFWRCAWPKSRGGGIEHVGKHAGKLVLYGTRLYCERHLAMVQENRRILRLRMIEMLERGEP